MLLYKPLGLTGFLDFPCFSVKAPICIHNKLFLLSIFCQFNLWISDPEPKEVKENLFLLSILLRLSWNLTCHTPELSFNMLLWKFFFPFLQNKNKKKQQHTVGQRQFFPESSRDLRVDWPLKMRLLKLLQSSGPEWIPCDTGGREEPNALTSIPWLWLQRNRNLL